MPVTISDDVLALGVTLRTTPRAGAEKIAEKAHAENPTEEGLAAYGVVKANAEQQFTLGVAYPANKPDAAIAQDGHRDFTTAKALERTAWSYMRKAQAISLFHRDGTSGHAEVVESYIYRGPDWSITPPGGGKPYVIKSGDWLLGTVWDDYGWNLVKQGLVRGWSPEGGARRRKPSADQLANLRD